MSIPDTQDWKFRSDVTLVGSTVTLEIKIVGTTVNLPVDIVAQSIGNIAVDIVAQSLTQLKVDIVAQSIGNLNINLADVSFAGNINVNIASQDITLNINVTNEAVPVGHIKSGLSFDGVDDYAKTDTINVGTNFTIFLWLKVNPTQNPYPFTIANKNTGGTSNGFSIWVKPTQIIWESGNGSAGDTVSSDTFDNISDTLVCIAIKYKDGIVYFYLNAVLKGSKTITNTDFNRNAPIYIAASANLVSDAFWRGIISQILIYNDALSQGDIQYNCNNPNAPRTNNLILFYDFSEQTGNKIYDKSGNGHDATIYGAIWVSEKGSAPASLNINIKAQTVGISIQAEWQTQIGNQKIITGTAVAVASDTDADVINYTVPSGKTLFIYAVSVKGIISGVGGSAPRGSWEFLIAGNYVWDANTNDYQPSTGQSFPVPLRANAGESVIVRVHNYETGSASFVADIDAYEV